MSQRYQVVRLAGLELPLAFSSTAIRLLERESGITLARLGFLLSTGRAGYGYLQMFLWAGLEGGRIRKKAGRPRSLEEVEALIDDTDGGPADVWRDPDDGMEEKEEPSESDPEVMVKVKHQVRPPVQWHPVMQAIIEAWFDAFPKARPGEPAPNPPTASESLPPGTNS